MSDTIGVGGRAGIFDLLSAARRSLARMFSAATSDAAVALSAEAAALLLAHPDGFDEADDVLASPAGREIDSAGLLAVDGGGWGTHMALSERGKRTLDHYRTLAAR